MKGVMAFASQKVEELAKENPTWKTDSWPRTETQGNGSYQEFGEEHKAWNSNGNSNSTPAVNGNSVSSSGRNFNSVDSGSWDDWDNDGNRKHASATGTSNGDDWAGWDDAKDDVDDSFYKSPPSNGKTTKSDGNWSGAGFL